MHWIFYRYFTFFPKPLVVRVRGGFKKSSYSFLHRIHMLPASHSAVVWCGSASPRPRVMTHHTLTLSSVQFPWPQPRCHSLPGVGQKSVLPTRRGRQAGSWLEAAACICTQPGASTRGCCVFALHPSSCEASTSCIFWEIQGGSSWEGV